MDTSYVYNCINICYLRPLRYQILKYFEVILTLVNESKLRWKTLRRVKMFTNERKKYKKNFSERWHLSADIVSKIFLKSFNRAKQFAKLFIEALLAAFFSLVEQFVKINKNLKWHLWSSSKNKINILYRFFGLILW